MANIRACRVESEYLNGLNAAGDAALADAVIAEKDNAFAKIQRYVNAADRAVKSVHRQLQETQQIRRHEEQLQKASQLHAESFTLHGAAKWFRSAAHAEDIPTSPRLPQPRCRWINGRLLAQESAAESESAISWTACDKR